MVRAKLALTMTVFTSLLQGCQTLGLGGDSDKDKKLNLPFLKNTSNECYFLDEFMPVPNNMVTGKMGAVNLRYYTYKAAFYKDWPERQVILSFYSKDSKCWSLFEEYYIDD